MSEIILTKQDMLLKPPKKDSNRANAITASSTAAKNCKNSESEPKKLSRCLPNSVRGEVVLPHIPREIRDHRVFPPAEATHPIRLISLIKIDAKTQPNDLGKSRGGPHPLVVRHWSTITCPRVLPAHPAFFGYLSLSRSPNSLGESRGGPPPLVPQQRRGITWQRHLAARSNIAALPRFLWLLSFTGKESN